MGPTAGRGTPRDRRRARLGRGGCAHALVLKGSLRCPTFLSMYDKLLVLLTALDGVRQDPQYHPEGDALFHSLQVFEVARAETRDWELLMAALVHDVGKAVDSAQHAEIGADLLEGLASQRVTSLVTHHLDLLRTPKATRRRLRGTRELADLEKLRRYDLAGRNPKAWVPSPEDALAYLMNMMHHSTLEVAGTTDDGGQY